MKGQFPLPLECLRIILNHLATVKSIRTLARLLRTNKYVCHATLPYLYSKPFAFFIPTNPNSTFMALLTDYPHLRRLTRTLLISVPDDQVPGLVKAMYCPESPPSQSWPIDYLSHLQHFQSQTATSWSLLVDLFRGLPLQPALAQYLDEHGLVAKYDARAPMVQWDENEEDSEGCKRLRPSILAHLDLDIHRELTWTLCRHVLGQIKSIVIPLSDMTRYLDAVPQMVALKSVTFKMDTVADTNEWWRPEEHFSASILAKLEQVKAQRREDLEYAVKFVQRHVALFPGMLTHVSCPSHKANLGATMQVCPDSILRLLMGSIKVRKKPTELTDKNWSEFVSNVAGTDLSRVRTMHVSVSYKDDWYLQLKATPFLHRCTVLDTYYMVSLGPDSFKWAVKKDAGVLPPLERVDIHAAREPLGSEVDDIGFAFGKKLQVLKATGYRWPQDAVVDQNNIPTVAIGRGWDMPVLKYLCVHMLSERLVLEPMLLSRCHDLRCLDLRDKLRRYNIREIQKYLPAELPSLTELFLSGTPALAFDPSTLRTTKELVNVILGSPDSTSQAFLDTAAEGEEDSLIGSVFYRPEWTWDWFLPRLVTLDLSIEFALSFQFRMLRGTPSLQTLLLTIFSTNGPAVERVLTESDFTTAPDDLHDTTSSPTAFNPYGIPHDEVSAIYHHLHSFQSWMEHPHALCGPTGHPDNNVDTARPTPTDAEQLQERRHGLVLRHDDYLGAFSGRQVAVREVFERHCRGIEAITASSPICRRVYDTLQEARVRYYKKKTTQATITAAFQSEQPGRLVVPSLKTLELNGHWVIADDALEMILGQVFSNLETLDLFGCKGFGTRAWIDATEGMPFLGTATLNRVLGEVLVTELGMTRLTARSGRDVPLFETETRKRLRYRFVDGDYTFAEGAMIEL